MGCGCTGNTTAGFIACAGASIAQPFADDNTMLTIAAGAGARTADWTMCVAVAFLKTRRFLYWKKNPGDCGTNAIGLSGLTAAESQLAGLGGGVASKLLLAPDPTFATKAAGAILMGVSTIFGVFSQAHIQAVQTEETTICEVSTRYNQFIGQIEQAIAQGKLSVRDAIGFMDQVVTELDPVLAGIAKKCCSVGKCDAACGYRFALRALQVYNEQYVFPGLAPYIPAIAPITSIFAPPASPAPNIAAPGPITSAVPTLLPTSIGLPGGQNGLILVGGGFLAARAIGAI